MPESIEALSPDQLYQAYGNPIQEPMKLIDSTNGQTIPAGIPSHIIVPAWFGAKSEDIELHEASIFLSDFGESFMPAAEPRHYSNAPRTVRPPEVKFEPEKPLSFAADIWTLACSIWAVLGQRSLLDIFCFTDDEVTKEQVDALGKLPQDWWERWDAKSQYFDSQGKPLEHVGETMTLEDRLDDSIQRPRQECGMDLMGDQERLALLSMLRAMLAFVPEERPTAASLLTCDWVTKWALPDLLKIRGSKDPSNGST